MTIKISYVPQYGEDPNKIDEGIVKSAGVCVVQYGDLACGKVSPYRCMVTDYSLDVNEGVLSYTFEMTSVAVSYNFLPYKATPGKLIGNQSTIENVIKVLKEAASRVKDHYTFEDPTGVLSSAEKFSTFEFPSESMSPIKFLIQTVSRIPCQDTKCRFSLNIDDCALLGDKGKIRIVKVDTSKVMITKSFNWGTRDSTVLEWVPNFKGAVWVASSRSRDNLDTGNVTLSSAVDPRTGDIITAAVDNSGSLNYKSADPTVLVNNLITSISDFSEKVDYVYDGDLTVLGEAEPVYLGETVISINPLINGKSHFSAGNYIVNEVVDTVNDDGFITKYHVQGRSDTQHQGFYGGTSYSKIKDKDVLWINGAFIPYDKYNPEGLQVIEDSESEAEEGVKSANE